MASIHKGIIINASAGDVWDAVRDLKKTGRSAA